MPSVKWVPATLLLIQASFSAVPALAGVMNPAHAGPDGLTPGQNTATLSLTAYTDRATWLSAAGTTTALSFDGFANGTLITTQLDGACISRVSGTSTHASPPGPVSQFVTASTALPFPMFISGTLPSEPNFISNDLNPGVYATGTMTFEMAGPTTAIGAFVADGAPLGGFSIEVFNGPTSLGVINVSARTLPNSFVGVVSSLPFNRATFYSQSPDDSWGLDQLEHNCSNLTPARSSTWGRLKSHYH